MGQSEACCWSAPSRSEPTIPRSGIAPEGARFIKLLGHVKLPDLEHGDDPPMAPTIVEQCGTYTANRAKSHLKSILALAEEDFGIRCAVHADRLARVRATSRRRLS